MGDVEKLRDKADSLRKEIVSKELEMNCELARLKTELISVERNLVKAVKERFHEVVCNE